MEIKLINVRSCPINIGIRKWLLLMFMRTFIFLLCTTVFGFNVETTLGQEKVIIELDKEATIDEVFKIIIDQTNYHFLYPENLFKDAPKVQLKKGTIRVDKLLNESISTAKFNIVLSANNTIVIKLKNTQQQIQISGKVTDVSGLPVPGVTVLIKGTSKGTVSDFDGNYSITVPNPENVLVFSALGFATQEITVGNQSTINIVLKESLSELDEVTINAGYYKTSKKTATGSISKVEAKVIGQQPESNPLAALQGRMSGVQITPTVGVPGGGFKVRIRGQNSIASGNEPLYIVDGVPYNSSSMSSSSISYVLRGDLSPLSLINPSDIESVEVLKDADATAIYGSRGANGVILITTKKGKEGKTSFNLSINRGGGKITKFIDYLTTEQFLEVRREAYANDGLDINNSDDPAVNGTWDQNRYTDWQKLLLGGTAQTNDLQASISGGSSGTQFFLGGGYKTESSVYPDNSKYKRGSVLAKINHASVDERFKLLFSTNYAVENGNLPMYDLVSDATTLAPNAPALYNDDGTLHFEPNFTNPLTNLLKKYANERFSLLANTVISYQILTSLELKANLGYTNTVLEEYTASPATKSSPPPNNDSQYSSVSINNSTRRNWIIEPQINWQNHIGEGKFMAMVATTFEKQLDKQFRASGYGFASDELLSNLSAATSKYITGDDEKQYKYQAIFGRLNYNWNDTYIINLTGRRDGSSRFGPNRQFANFGAVGAAWVFSKESFATKVFPFINYGKLRGSYGTSGNDQIGDYEFLDTFTIMGEAYDGIIGMQPARLYNPNFAWEVNKKLEFALELNMFKDRIQLTTSYFRNISTNQLVGIPLPTSTGFTFLTANLDAKVKNTGLELDLHTVNFQKTNFQWATSFNVTFPDNELVEFPGLEESTYANTYVVGESLSIQKLYHYTGLSTDRGIYQYEDYNNDGAINSAHDKQWIEDMAPKYYGGISNSLTYKNLSLDFFFQFTKQKSYNFLESIGLPGGWGNMPSLILDRWQQPGDQSIIQRYTTGADGEAYDAYDKVWRSNIALTDASFIRLKNISIGYTIPASKMNGVNCRLYFQGQNLLTFSNYKGPDPEQAGQRLGVLKRLNFGVEMNF